MTDLSNGQPPSTSEAATGQATPLADHVIAFGRILRRAGLRVGSGQIVDALRAVEVVGVERREDVYQAFYSVFVRRQSEVELFDGAFHLFWRAPSELSEMMQMMLPSAGDNRAPEEQPRQRVQEALEEPKDRPPERAHPVEEAEIEVSVSFSRTETLKEKDFADFSAEEVAAAKELMQRMRWPVAPRRVRRLSAREKGRPLDLRRTVRGALRHHGELLDLCRRGPKKKPRPIVLLCDISGSMEPYSRMLLHFMHAVTAGMEQRVESFVFGTRLTRITHHLRRRDVDEAVARVSDEVQDWAGGTRIGEAIRAFNYVWLRRVLRSGGVALVISDGCDRGDAALLGKEMARLRRACHHLFWLNPLLRYAGYEPLTQGIQAALPHVDSFLPVHNLESLEQLGQALAKATGG